MLRVTSQTLAWLVLLSYKCLRGVDDSSNPRRHLFEARRFPSSALDHEVAEATLRLT